MKLYGIRSNYFSSKRFGFCDVTIHACAHFIHQWDNEVKVVIDLEEYDTEQKFVDSQIFNDALVKIGEKIKSDLKIRIYEEIHNILNNHEIEEFFDSMIIKRIHES